MTATLKRYETELSWVWRLLTLVGIVAVGYLQLWGDARWVTEAQLKAAFEAELKPIRQHMDDDEVHMTFRTKVDTFVLRSEWDKSETRNHDDLTELKELIKLMDAKIERGFARLQTTPAP